MSDDLTSVLSFGVGTATPRQGYNRDLYIRTPKHGGRGQLTAAATTLYTAPSGSIAGSATQKATLKSLILCNTDTASHTVTIYLVESGGAAADNRAIYKDLPLAAKATSILTFPDDCCTLDSGETIQGLADLTLKVTYKISVVELT